MSEDSPRRYVYHVWTERDSDEHQIWDKEHGERFTSHYKPPDPSQTDPASISFMIDDFMEQNWCDLGEPEELRVYVEDENGLRFCYQVLAEPTVEFGIYREELPPSPPEEPNPNPTMELFPKEDDDA